MKRITNIWLRVDGDIHIHIRSNLIGNGRSENYDILVPYEGHVEYREAMKRGYTFFTKRGILDLT